MESGTLALRFGILAPGWELSAWAVRCVERLIESGRAAPAVLIRARQPNGHAPELAWLPRLYHEHWVKARSSALQSIDLSERLSQLRVIDAAADGAGTLSPATAAALDAERLDFILAFGLSSVPDGFLDIPRFGVWSFSQERRAAACWREVLEGRDKTRIALERLTPTGPVPLCEGYFATCKASWVNTIDRVQLGVADFAVKACALLSPGQGQPRSSSNGLELSEERARNRDLLRMMLRNAGSALEKVWELAFHVETWNVGFSTRSLEQILRDPRLEDDGVSWCDPHRPGHFIADPFVYVEGGEPRILVEDYDQVKGRICTVRPSNGARRLELDVALELPQHMSYPCIFEEAGEVYCIPEVYQSRCASLYRRRGGAWELVRHLIEEAPIVDPTLFKHAGRYWILCTLQDDGAWGNQKLYAYHAASLDGAWTPHPHNPVKCDIGATRPAGNVFEVGGRLYRPSQDCSRTYGGAVVIHEIVTLSPTDFEEREVARLDPIASSPYPSGFHTLNAMGSGIVFDSKKFSFDWFAWRKNWGRFHEVFR